MTRRRSPSSSIRRRRHQRRACTQYLTDTWPRLAGRIEFSVDRLQAVGIAADDLVVSVHACGALSDAVLDRAIAARARVAVVPCCHDGKTCDGGGLDGWMDPSLAIDAVRAMRLERAGYQIRTLQIPAAVTAKNRLLLGDPVRVRPAGADTAVASGQDSGAGGSGPVPRNHAG